MPTQDKQSELAFGVFHMQSARTGDRGLARSVGHNGCWNFVVVVDALIDVSF